MTTMHKTLFLIVAAAASFVQISGDSINSGITFSNVVRKIDISTHLVKISSAVTLENGDKKSVGSFLVAVEPTLKDNLSFLGAGIKGDDEVATRLTASQATVAGHSDKQFWKITLPEALASGKSLTVTVDMMFAHSLTPFPQQITQAEKQYVVFNGNLFFYSPYTVKKQETTVTTASSTIESYTKTKPVSLSDNSIKYGPYEDKAGFSQAELRVHSENNTPFLTVTSMERVIEVSHWGNIAIEEQIEVRHSGAILKGSFSRYDYQRSQDQGSSVKSFKTFLPAAARDVYYRDEIGNISTSAMKEQDDVVELELRPRFPLFGGWKTKYTIGYNVPSYQYLYNEGDKYELRMRFVDHIFDDLVVDQITFKIILPEGANVNDLWTPFDVTKGEGQLHYTYLDTTGRPVIVAYKNNLVDQHIQDFKLSYTFQKWRLLQEPLLVVGAFYLLFLLVIFYVRLDFSITKDEVKESKMRVASLLEEVQSAQDKRSALYQSYDDAIDKFKANKDSASFLAARKKIDTDYKQLTQQITGLQGQLKNEGSELAEKVAELNRYDTQYKEQITLATTQAEKLINGKMGKSQYVESEKQLTERQGEIYKKMEDISSSLQ